MKREIILTVHKIGDQHYRLSLSKEDSSVIKPSSARSVSISLGNEVIEIDDALNTYQKYNNIVSTEINSWISEKGYDNYLRNENTKLIFSVETNGDSHHYEFYSNQA
jgi:uncharacterized membrane-anchored protein